MPDLFASFAGSRIVSARVTLPLYGAWTADVVLADDSEVPATGTLTIADRSLVGAVWRGVTDAPKGGTPFASSRSLRLVGGAGGWSTTVPRQFYSDPKGVQLGMVLRDVAVVVGETINVPAAMASQVLGEFWARGAHEASRVLSLVLAGQWWVDSAGVTQVGARTGSTFAWDGPIETCRPDLGFFVIAVEDLAPWVPGASFTSPLVTGAQLISSVAIVLASDGKLRIEVLTGAGDRLMRAVDRIVQSSAARSTAPSAEHLAVWSYSVTSATESTFTGRAVSARCPEPDLPKVPNMPGIPGALLKPAVGSVVGVAFLDGDPAKPRVMTWDPTKATVVKLRASSDPTSPALTVEIAPSGAQVYEEPNTPPAQAVALAPAVASFASAAVSLETAAAVFSAAVAAFVAAPAVTALATGEAASVATAATALVTASNLFISTVNGLGGTFPTGFTATKLSTQ